MTWEYDNWKSDEKDVGVDGFENKNEKRAAQYKAISAANRAENRKIARSRHNRGLIQ